MIFYSRQLSHIPAEEPNGSRKSCTARQRASHGAQLADHRNPGSKLSHHCHRSLAAAEPQPPRSGIRNSHTRGVCPPFRRGPGGRRAGRRIRQRQRFDRHRSGFGAAQYSAGGNRRQYERGLRDGASAISEPQRIVPRARRNALHSKSIWRTSSPVCSDWTSVPRPRLIFAG